MISRRGLIGGIGLLLAAPAIVKVENLMKLSVPKPISFLYTNVQGITVNLPRGHGFAVGDFIKLIVDENIGVEIDGVQIVSIEANTIKITKQENGLWA